MKILGSGTVKIDAESFVFSNFNFSGPTKEVPGGARLHDMALLAGLAWVEQRAAEERARVLAKMGEDAKEFTSIMDGVWHQVLK